MQDTFLTDVAQFTHKTRDEPARIVADDSIEFREGEHVTVRDGSSLSTAGVVSIAILGSMALAGKPVRCSGVVPGVTLLVSTGGLRSRDGDDADQLIDDIWRKIRPGLVDWLTMRTSPAGVTMALGSEIRLEGGADKMLDYLEVVHVLVRRPRSSGSALSEVGKTHQGDHQAIGLSALQPGRRGVAIPPAESPVRAYKRCGDNESGLR